MRVIHRSIKIHADRIRLCPRVFSIGRHLNVVVAHINTIMQLQALRQFEEYIGRRGLFYCVDLNVLRKRCRTGRYTEVDGPGASAVVTDLMNIS